MSAVISQFSSLRLGAGLLAVMALVGCTAEPEVAAPGSDVVIAAHVEAGMDLTVAECLVGIGSQELSMFALMPDGERSSADQLLIEELTRSCEEASAFVLDEPLEPDALAFVDQPFTFGDDARFDRLWERCELGDGVACDDLWETAPVGSEYERFGVTCGDRDQVVDCGVELTEETVEAIDTAAAEKAEAKAARTDGSQPD